jgi:transposase
MNNIAININTATYVGIDAHPTEHTAVAINRFEEEKGKLRFANTLPGIAEFLSWLPTIEKQPQNVAIGIEGRGTSGNAIVSRLLESYQHVYEVNPLYTKQRRTFGTRGRKSDPVDAKLIAEVVTKKASELPKITKAELSTDMLSLKRLVWFYEEITVQGARIKNQLHRLEREKDLSSTKEEKSNISFILSAKQRELERIQKTRQSLKIKLTRLLPENGRNLLTLPGVSIVLASAIVAYTNWIHRFANRDKFVQYAGIGLLERSSGKKKRFIQSNKGNRMLNRAFYLVALYHITRHPESKAYYENKLQEGKSKKHAMRCVMRKVAWIVYSMMKSGKEFRGKIGKKKLKNINRLRVLAGLT